MHHMVLVLVDAIERATEQVETLLAPYSEYYPDGHYENAHYDFFTIGGRWSGTFRDVCPPSEVGLQDDHPLAGNICPVRRLPDDQDAGSIVTPDGKWHFFGWRFGGEDLDPDLRALLKSIRGQWSDRLAVIVDCHS